MVTSSLRDRVEKASQILGLLLGNGGGQGSMRYGASALGMNMVAAFEGFRNNEPSIYSGLSRQ